MTYMTINNKTKLELETILKKDSSYRVRDRAKAILLSNNKTNINEISKILSRSRRTIHRWFNRFKDKQTENLKDKKGQGRKPILDIDKDSKRIQKYIKDNSIKETCIIINKELKNKSISTKTLKRFLKKITFPTKEQEKA